jgi:AcrR family transcriptional regulator
MMLTPQTSQRGPAEHERREQIIGAASEHFRHYGYTKTTVADLAKAIGLSTAYIYKFFDSKKAIGEAVCSICLGEISGALRAIRHEPKPAADRLRRMYVELARRGSELFFNDRKMHDIVAAALSEEWQPCQAYAEDLHGLLRELVQEGRDAGEFERKTPLDETCRAIMLTMETMKNPRILEMHLDTLEDDAALLAALVLRSLSP